ncbi:MAG: peptide chain release factor N(5)-glutamine methyltransferase [Candidatus Izemoplasmatales bacterium]|jgi:release factor glutamine methyltransferase|nr:peptide chain release factor N(5)-glutamine methyltransferase [Candidatus Izemoplasmatales bacterium]MDD3865692.1 peptide chain release factor N(5)-glutamine methyltransferase [Candidatus Izemoplasmatales bacterium]
MALYSAVLRMGEKLARAQGMETSGIKLLLMHFSRKTPTQLYLDIDQEMPEVDQVAFMDAVDLYVNHHRPVQYIMGYVSFYGYDFIVNEAVLIPRFETEELVANVLIQYDEVFSGEPVKLVDIGTGSGCLAITFAKEEPQIEVTATDISEAALIVAKQNANRLGAHISLLQGDMLTPIKNMKFDIIVSNPPYIPDTEMVDDIIKDNEPNIALFGGYDGLKFYRIIIEEAQKVLNPRFIMAFEHGFDKAEEIRALALKYYPNADIFTIKDMQNKDRMTFIVNK